MSRLIIMVTLAGFTAILAARGADAAVIVDTGTPVSSSSGPSLSNRVSSDPNGDFQWLAGQFSLSQSYTIDSVEGFVDENNGVISLAIYGGGSSEPNVANLLFRQSFGVVNTPGAGWHGVSGMNLTLAPGTYWAAFEVLNPGDYDGYMPGPPPNPLDAYAFFNSGLLSLGENDYRPTGSSFAMRVATAESAAVPEPSTLVLLGSAAALSCLVRRRKKLERSDRRPCE